MSINTEINRLLNFAKQNMLINEDDYYYAANRLLDVLKVDAFEPEFVDEKLPTAMPILENMLDYAAEKGLIENTTENRDLFDTRIMDCVMPRPSEVVRRFTNDYARSPKAAPTARPMAASRGRPEPSATRNTTDPSAAAVT